MFFTKDQEVKKLSCFLMFLRGETLFLESYRLRFLDWQLRLTSGNSTKMFTLKENHTASLRHTMPANDRGMN